MKSIVRHESRVRSYCRAFPATFTRARGSTLWDRDGNAYLDFLSGAGALNYGHNPPDLKRALLDYLEGDGVVHSLDMATEAKERLLEQLHEVILAPRGLRYRVQFPGPTGTNAVEAALKLARKATGRTGIISFTNAFHGMTLGSLAVTGNGMKRGSAGISLGDASSMPFDGFLGAGIDTLDVLEAYLTDSSSGVSEPAAIILETLQGEGGVNPASTSWLRRLESLARRHGILLIVDDIQVGCGRTGPFFSFERAGLEPDVVCLSKSLSGYGLPLSLVLLREELDVWSPGEHNGTFRGHNPAFVTATAAMERWRTGRLARETARKGQRVRERLASLVAEHGGSLVEARGLGLLQGIECQPAELAGRIARQCFERGLIIETSGSEDQVLKLLPPLVIEDAELERGLDIIAASVEAALESAKAPAASAIRPREAVVELAQ